MSGKGGGWWRGEGMREGGREVGGEEGGWKGEKQWEGWGLVVG